MEQGSQNFSGTTTNILTFNFEETNTIAFTTQQELTYLKLNFSPVTNPTEDNESPIITLEPGVSPVRLSVGDSWTLPTATAVDNVDGDISFIDVDTTLINQFYNSSTSQYIFTSTGTYEVEFTAADESGNIATKVITIIVSDDVDGYTGYYESINGLSGQALVDELYTVLNNTGTI